MRFVWLFLFPWLGLSLAAEPTRNLAAEPVASPQRIALVIGNSAYPGTGALRNPANDARDIAARLKRSGFDVLVRTDVRQKEMLRSLTEFGEKIRPGAEVLFFYAGHGMQVRGKNYLIPIDAEIRSESATSSEAIDVDQLLDKLGPARLAIVVLDACRNNPFERKFRGGGQGLAQINAPSGTLIAYATAPGKVAADGSGRNGLYTSELLAAMGTPGLKVEDVFKRVRANVMHRSGEAQTPWESSSLTGDFYFLPPATSGAPSSVPAASVPTVADPVAVELAYWDSVKESRDPDAYKSYLDQYPEGRFVALAKLRIRDLSTSRNGTPDTTSLRTPEMDFLEGSWEYQQVDNYAHMQIHWNPTTAQYEGVLMRQGKISHWVGFVLGEVVWKAKPTSNPRRLMESQLSRVGANGISQSLKWLDGELNLDRSTPDEIVSSFGKLRRVGTAVGDAQSGNGTPVRQGSPIMIAGFWIGQDGAVYQLAQDAERVMLRTTSRPVLADEVQSTYSLVGGVPITQPSQAEFQLQFQGSRVSGTWSRNPIKADKCVVPAETATVEGEYREAEKMLLLRHARGSYKAATQMSLLGDDSCGGVTSLGRNTIEEVLRGPLGPAGVGGNVTGLTSWWDGGFSAIQFGWQGRIGVRIKQGSAAYAAGLRDEDEILDIDGTAVKGLTPGEAMLRLHGAPQSTVALSIRRKGEAAPIRLSLQRIVGQ